jgi:folylpolyglutamate synthase/dihydropteroate synthase
VAFESEHVADAVRRALDMAGPNDLVLGTGSLSVAAEVIQELEGMVPELYPNLGRPAPHPDLP